MEISDRIKDLRKNMLKMSQEEFGKALGVSRDVIGNIEYDRLKRPDQKEPIYKLICEKFNINEKWLRTGEGEPRIPLTRKQAIADFMDDCLKDEEDSFRSGLIEALAELSVEEWEVLEKIATTAIKNKDKKKD